MKEGKLIVISGISGVGKSSIYKAMVERYDNYVVSVSKTTRAPRAGETDGVDYFFCTREAFEKAIAEDELIEYAVYLGNYYGTPKSYVMQQLAAGKDVILEIEVQGAFQIREKFPDAILVFVAAPSIEETFQRLAGRGTESDAVIEERIRRGREEFALREKYDIVLVNDDFENSIARLHRYIQERNFQKEI